MTDEQSHAPTDHRRALAEAQAWVMARLPLGNPAEALRSAELGKHLRGYPEFYWWQKSDIAEMEQLFARRRALLQGSEVELLPPTKGRTLCCMCDWDTSMGEGEPASEGLIDLAYLPPWDTWFAVLSIPDEQYVLLAWIPEELIVLVQNAIEVAATQPIGWLDEAVSWVWPDNDGYIGGNYSESSRTALAEVLSSLSPQ